MELENIVNSIIANSQEIFQVIRDGYTLPPMGMRRSARLAWLTALRQTIEQPILLITDRNDRAMMLADELALWAPDIPRQYFPGSTFLAAINLLHPLSLPQCEQLWLAPYPDENS
jgi:hypothetical protein